MWMSDSPLGTAKKFMVFLQNPGVMYPLVRTSTNFSAIFSRVGWSPSLPCFVIVPEKALTHKGATPMLESSRNSGGQHQKKTPEPLGQPQLVACRAWLQAFTPLLQMRSR
ncbi:hypothetical protein ACA910_008888 [Epithemia clementina (nom. ined.)]